MLIPFDRTKRYMLAYVLLFQVAITAHAQPFNTFKWKADSSYNAKSFAAAAPFYVKAGEVADFPFQRKRVY